MSSQFGLSLADAVFPSRLVQYDTSLIFQSQKTGGSDMAKITGTFKGQVGV